MHAFSTPVRLVRVQGQGPAAQRSHTGALAAALEGCLAMADETSTNTMLVESFRVLSDRLSRTSDVDAALHEAVTLAHRVIPFCDWAGITQAASRERFTTIAATDPLVIRADELQYTLAEGPCVDAVRTDGLFQADDLATTGHWPRFGTEVVRQTPIRSALSLTIHPAPSRAAINLYSGSTHVFTTESVDIATLFAAHAQILLTLARQTDKVAHLHQALTTSRLIGNAVGILMYAHRITSDEAFDRLRAASSQLNRKLIDIAGEVTETGELPDTPSRSTEP